MIIQLYFIGHFLLKLCDYFKWDIGTWKELQRIKPFTVKDRNLFLCTLSHMSFPFLLYNTVIFVLY